jgi:hypothetical protein
MLSRRMGDDKDIKCIMHISSDKPNGFIFIIASRRIAYWLV